MTFIVCLIYSPNSEKCAVVSDVIWLSVSLCVIIEQLLCPFGYAELFQNFMVLFYRQDNYCGE